MKDKHILILLLNWMFTVTLLIFYNIKDLNPKLQILLSLLITIDFTGKLLWILILWVIILNEKTQKRKLKCNEQKEEKRRDKQ